MDSMPENYMYWDLAQCKRRLRKRTHALLAHYRMACIYLEGRDWAGAWKALE